MLTSSKLKELQSIRSITHKDKWTIPRTQALILLEMAAKLVNIKIKIWEIRAMLGNWPNTKVFMEINKC